MANNSNFHRKLKADPSNAVALLLLPDPFPNRPVTGVDVPAHCVRASAEVSRSSHRTARTHELRIKTSALLQPLAQTLRPYIGPVLFDVLETRSAVRFAVNHLPTGWNVGEGGPQAVLFLVIDQDEKTAIVVVKWIDAHRFSRPSGSHEFGKNIPEAKMVGSILDEVPMRPIRGRRTVPAVMPFEWHEGEFRPRGHRVLVAEPRRFVSPRVRPERETSIASAGRNVESHR
jgi:hypothetical protein